MTKREFMVAYVLNRAATVTDMDGKGSAERAEVAWNVIISKTQTWDKKEITQ